MSFKGQLIKLGFKMDGINLALWQSAARMAIGGNIQTDVRLSIGSSSNKMTIDAATDRAIEAYANCTLTSGTARQANFDYTVGANGAITEAFRVTVGCEYTPGAWMNAIVGRIDLGTTGTGGGMAAAVCAEMNMPAQSYTSYGAPCYSLDCEFSCPTGFVAGDRSSYPIGFLKFGLWGNTKGQFDDEGVIFHTDGLTAEADHCLSVTMQTLRVNTESSHRYMVLSQMQDGLGLGVSGTNMVLSASKKAVDIYTSHSATSGTVRSVNIEHEPSASGAILEAFRVSVAQEYNGGAWVNAIVGRIDLGTTGTGGGMSAAICAEMNMPAQDYSSYGAPCYSLDCEFSCPSGFVAGDRSTYPIAWINFAIWGNTKGQFDDEGFVFHTDGLTAAADHLLSATSQTLRANIEASDRYLVLSQLQDGLGLGNSTTDMNLSTTQKAVDIYTADTSTSGTVRSFNLEHTVGANGAIYEALRVNVGCEYSPGAWMNAIVGRIDLGTTGTGGGTSAAICAEMNMPGQDYASYGAPCYSLACEFGCPTGFVAGDRTTYPIAFIKFGLWGNTKGEFDDRGYLFHIDGATGADNHMFDDSVSGVTNPQIEAALRININGTAWYIPLCDQPNLN